MIFDNMPSIIQHIRGGAVRALGVTTTQRSPQLPDVQAISETVPGYEASALFGILGLALADPMTAMVKTAMERRSERLDDDRDGAGDSA